MGIEKALADCLGRIESGELTPEEALQEYPALRDELEPLLGLVAELRSMPRVMAPQSLRSYKRPVFRGMSAGEPAWRRWLAALASPGFGWTAPLARAAAALVVVLLLGGGTMVASANSQPEEPFYPVKLALESVQLVLATNPQARAELELQLAARRLQEVEKAAREGKAESVQRGVALYEQRVESALEAAEAETGAAESSQTRQIENSLKHNYQVLEEVLSKLEDKPQTVQARAALQRAIERTAERTQLSMGGVAKDDKKPARPPAAGVAVAPGPAQTPAAPTSTATAVPAEERERPEKGKPHSEPAGLEKQGDSQERKSQEQPLKAQGPEKEEGRGAAWGQQASSPAATAIPSASNSQTSGAAALAATAPSEATATAPGSSSTSPPSEPAVERERGRDREKLEREEKNGQQERTPQAKKAEMPQDTTSTETPRQGVHGSDALRSFLQDLWRAASSLPPLSRRE